MTQTVENPTVGQPPTPINASSDGNINALPSFPKGNQKDYYHLFTERCQQARNSKRKKQAIVREGQAEAQKHRSERRRRPFAPFAPFAAFAAFAGAGWCWLVLAGSFLPLLAQWLLHPDFMIATSSNSFRRVTQTLSVCHSAHAYNIKDTDQTGLTIGIHLPSLSAVVSLSSRLLLRHLHHQLSRLLLHHCTPSSHSLACRSPQKGPPFACRIASLPSHS